MQNSDHFDIRKKFAFTASLLFFVGLITGIWAAATLSGVVKVAQPRIALSAHVNALMGTFWLLGVSYSIQFLSYSKRQIQKLFYFIAIPCWANWSVTTIASFLGVSGLSYSADASNNGIALLLQTLVVLPSLAGTFYWIRGFRTVRI